jgi:hypothetical protein
MRSPVGLIARFCTLILPDTNGIARISKKRTQRYNVVLAICDHYKSVWMQLKHNVEMQFLKQIIRYDSDTTIAFPDRRFPLKSLIPGYEFPPGMFFHNSILTFIPGFPGSSG